MTILRTGAGLSRRDIRGLKRDRYEIQAIETWNLDDGDLTTIIWERDDGPDAITEAEDSILTGNATTIGRVRKDLAFGLYTSEGRTSKVPKNADRPQLREAIAHCRKTGATLIGRCRPSVALEKPKPMAYVSS